MSKIEKEFEDLATAINAKIAEAGKLLAEANTLAEEAGVPYLAYNEYCMEDCDEEQRAACEALQDLVSFRPVLGALDEAGWSTSSLHC